MYRSNRTGLSGTLVILLAFLLAFGSSGLHQAAAAAIIPDSRQTPGATITVSVTADEMINDGSCSLREAIQSANQDTAVGGCAAGSGADTIILPAGTYSLARAGANEDANQTGDLDILGPVTIRGQGEAVTFVDGGRIDRVFHVVQTGTIVHLQDFTVQNGLAAEEDELGGGGILSWGNLALLEMTFTGNTASRGGGVRNSEGTLTVLSSTFTLNDAIFEGGGLYSNGRMTVRESLVRENTSPRGAGVSSDDLLEMTDVTLSGNIAEDGDGGGMYNDFDAWLDRVTFSENQALRGGGIYNNQVLYLTNVTFSSNTGVDSETLRSQGGALYNHADVDLQNVTLFGNSATLGGGLYNDADGFLTITASILANSTQGRNCINVGEFTSGGYNLEDAAWCPLDQSTDFLNVNPQLQPLQFNSGRTQSHAILPGSPATDLAPDDACAIADQRNILRPVDGDQDGEALCDAGAYEGAPGGILRFNPSQTSLDEQDAQVTLAVTRTGGSGSVGVRYAPAGGTAALGSDFYLTDGTLSWPNGDESVKNFPVSVFDDLFKENGEYALIGLFDPTNGAGILRPHHLFTLVIEANDPNGIAGGDPLLLPVIFR